MKRLMTYISILLLQVGMLQAAVPEEKAPEWPRKLETENARITIYQPQINSLDGDLLDARSALSVKRPGESLVFGAMWFNSRLITDFDTRMVSLKEIEVTSVKIPEADEETEAALIKQLETRMTEADLSFSLDKFLTSMKMLEQEQELSDDLNHAPPVLFFEDEAAVLVSIDGEPILEEIENTKIKYVVNTPYFLIYNTADMYFYLKGGKWWYRASRVDQTWRHVDNPPQSVLAIAEQAGDYEASDVDSVANLLRYPPKVIVSTVPAELIIINGEPEMASLEGTNLLYVRNTESEILMDINTQDYYLLVAGRWYRSKEIAAEGWVFVNPAQLPETFTNIAASSELGSVRSSIPGTKEAEEAMLENQIPQTAEIDRKNAEAEVEYDGNPQFEQISGTSMQYAVNTNKSVLLINNRYYCVDNAIWFESPYASGPWEVCVNVPNVVYTIPPQYPVYNVKYVHVYDYSPDVVYVGYTPGYVYSYGYRGTVVYGTGYHYRSWYHRRYYPRPVTYGYGVHYNPYTGWGFHVGVSYGWIGHSRHYRPYGVYYTSYWGPTGYRCGYRHGHYHGFSRSYYHGYYRGYRYGVYASSRSGYSTGFRDGYHTAMSQNVYHAPSKGVIHTGVRASRSSYSKPSSASRKNNVYTDRQGNVYRKKGDSWQSRESGSWNRSTNPSRNASGTRSRTEGDGRSYKSSTESRESRSATSSPRTSSSSRNTSTSSGTQTRRSSTGTKASSTRSTTTSRTSTGSNSSNNRGSTTRSSSTTRSRSSGTNLERESRARTQGSKRSYEYKKSQPQQRSSGTSAKSRSSSGTVKKKPPQSSTPSRRTTTTSKPSRR